MMRADMRDQIRFRPKTEADLPFMAQLYASTRVEEMNSVPWTDEQKAAFLDMQFRAQTEHYDTYYSTCDFLIIEKEGVPVGRLYIDRFPEGIHIVDIALTPEFRGSGIGTMLLREIMAEAGESNRPVTIYVEAYNPALRLYQRLGFKHVDSNGVYNKMRWDAAETTPT